MQTLPILRLSTRIISWKPQAPKLRLGVMLMGKKNKIKNTAIIPIRDGIFPLPASNVFAYTQHSLFSTKANMLRTTHTITHERAHTHTHTHTITQLLRQTVAGAGMSLVRSTSLWGDIHLRLHYRLIWSTNKDSHARQYPLPLADRATCSAPTREVDRKERVIHIKTARWLVETEF